MVDIKKVAVIGAGVMGHGIAEVVAMSGRDVNIYDHKKQNLKNALKEIEKSLAKLEEKDRISETEAIDTLNKIETVNDLQKAVIDRDFVIEVVPENLELKRDLFARLDRYTPEHTVLASGTSSLPITEIARATTRPEKVVGMHWFNPPVLMDLVEVIYGEKTSKETAETTYKFAETMDKIPIYCKKDVRGFIVTNIIGAFYGEAMWMFTNGEAEIKEIDAAMVHQKGYPMGPFELLDLTGIDIVYDVRKEAGLKIPPVMEDKINKKQFGRKTGKGFYNYREGQGADYKERDGEKVDTLQIEARMVNEASKLIEIDAATPKDIDTGMKLGARFPEGPCRRGDKIGLDKITNKLQKLHDKYKEERYKPTELLKNKLKTNKIGERKGEGFYNYIEPTKKTYHAIKTQNPDEKGVVKITLDRPSRMNALNEEMMTEIPEFIKNLDQNNVRCIVIEGKGDKAFSIGAEIDMLKKTKPTRLRKLLKVFQILENYPTPVIAKIDGYALGGGLELAISCDLRIATKRSKFAVPEINIGLIPGGGGTHKLPRLIGETRAKQMIYLGEKINAETAENWGLINKTVPKEKLNETVKETINKITKGPPIALSQAKKTIKKTRQQKHKKALELQIETLTHLLETQDFQEGIKAFKEKREPNFKGK
ncbi:enoyl-CoA hydratase-related protein [Methanonatronarchaeum sp. AMET-Sl]|uniref:3-hydroxyacyl-CoA dehydrogenase/enoyl-CoA hydratase family protein n=1 Tax=Methanonatronarchaeum sp. AMET-Sl TaxID=3037654 RepID=UPI00244E1A4D|nr:enoyl-CoA hydratase-related protein [Methanonatronarchaeum sp. AMET-Sl]WGI17979.1 enoyl-CoA hydratase-related protein [Methanonatronarchaeum sp. AMET-Sl]